MHRSILLITLATVIPGLTAQGSRTRVKVPIPELLKRLDDPDRRVWQRAMYDLTRLKGPAVPHLVRHMSAGVTGPEDARKASYGAVRAVQVLWRIGAPSASSVPVLLATLQTAPSRLQTAIVLGLGKFGPHAKSPQRKRIRTSLVTLVVEDPNADVAGQASNFMREHVLEHQEAWRTHARTRLSPRSSVVRLVRTLADDNPFLREYAAELLAKPRPRDENAVAALSKMLDTPQPTCAVMTDIDGTQEPEPEINVFYDRKIQSQVARALVRMAPDDPRALPAFELLLTRPISLLRLEGLFALRRAGAAAAKLLPLLVPMARKEEPVLQREAVTILGMIGPGASVALPILEKLAKGGDKQLAARAKAALRGVKRK